ncbi:MAG TPA: hypothetical protein DCX54_06600 [Flavobacteriales bacterium]|nr:hypothetical protein [Flavobacteriales bacterium]
MKILIADDHIPDEDVIENEIEKFVEEKYQSRDPKLIERFVFMRKMLNKLRSAGFEIDACNHAAAVDSFIQENDYDAAVIDLGWYADDDITYNNQPFEGWHIIEIVQKKRPALPVIMYSNRLYEDPLIPLGAADKGVLPVYKYFEDACIDNLIAILRFVSSMKEQVRRIDTKTYKNISIITTTLMVVALIFLVLGLGMLLLNKTEEGQLTAGVSFITSMMSGVFWKYLSDVRKNILS